MKLRELLLELENGNFKDKNSVTIDDQRALDIYEDMKRSIQYVFEYFPPDEHLMKYYIAEDKKTSTDKEQQKYFDLRFKLDQLDLDLNREQNKLIRNESMLDVKRECYAEYEKELAYKKAELNKKAEEYIVRKAALEKNFEWLYNKKKECEENRDN